MQTDDYDPLHARQYGWHNLTMRTIYLIPQPVVGRGPWTLRSNFNGPYWVYGNILSEIKYSYSSPPLLSEHKCYLCYL